ncbi:MAG: tyrosine--tRNA ligase [Pirellulaceae bacterium]|nr:tyrosine--tRNA ligase [Pirellulaceae bacterium]
MTDVFTDLKWRGLIHQATDEQHLQKWLSEGCRTLYIGFDPTADSLHVGSLLQLMMLRRFQRAGHRPIALVGGATGMIGDPSGKNDERNLLSLDALHANVLGMEQQMRSFLDFDCGKTSAALVNNADWMRNFSYLDFLRDVGKHFPVNVMMNKDSVKSRLQRDDGGISFTEFSYMLLQAYDFVHLSAEFDCELQCGGSDQWGNITAGIDLARRLRGQQLYGITCPLLTKADGSKMGKTESGTIWLAADRTSPYQFYQYWINVTDEDVGKCLRVLTELSQEEIEALDCATAERADQREAQKRLAEELTKLVHGAEGYAVATQATRIFFGEEISDLSDSELLQIFSDVPSETLERSRIEGEGLTVIDGLIATGLVKSKGEARRAIEQGGAYVNNRRVTELAAMLTAKDLASESVIVLRRGKRNYALLRLSS